ncbi:P-type conjugative transfer protein TrbG [Xanthomonas campestris pv. campestris]|nr:P-type conjugative transfer protein TrbG [Xanthomonas campestris pv. campestris]MEB1179666.1 P-type conjugative transfer protein TrbG [Xanthomonas campestris pv. campestris]MEB1203492.1 P-type conjugative transfer protein TrbG [Xanthomonas campestris pv. campestris]MEB1240973.1 P-type conjugative transfer protein TrbG [Xanthomonas campestris pv. campestris]MEB1378872.1 P-type conjugative transfer protein TrbG [Xanthomonas campestris pv. campestris]
MQTMKTHILPLLLLTAGAANAQTAPQVPAITSALNDNATATANANRLPDSAATSTPAYVPPPAHPERLSPRVAKARSDFDSKQRAQVAEYVGQARQVPTSSSTANVGGQTIFTYRPGALYTIYVGAGRQTVIDFQPGEQLTGEVNGSDTVRWLISQVTSGTDAGEQVHLVLKAVEPGLTNDLFIATNRRTYLVTARSVADWSMPSVSWQYPMDTWKAKQAVAAKREAVEPVAVAPDALHFNYDIKGGRYSWKPMQVFDDGAQTYIRMPATLNATDAPALFLIEKGEPLLVNYRVKGVANGTTGPTYIVDRVFDRAELRVGAKQAITIRRR